MHFGTPPHARYNKKAGSVFFLKRIGLSSRKTCNTALWQQCFGVEKWHTPLEIKLLQPNNALHNVTLERETLRSAMKSAAIEYCNRFDGRDWLSITDGMNWENASTSSASTAIQASNPVSNFLDEHHGPETRLKPCSSPGRMKGECHQPVTPVESIAIFNCRAFHRAPQSFTLDGDNPGAVQRK